MQSTSRSVSEPSLEVQGLLTDRNRIMVCWMERAVGTKERYKALGSIPPISKQVGYTWMFITCIADDKMKEG